MSRLAIALLATFCVCELARGEAGATPAFAAGQEWSYRIDGKESAQTLVILASGTQPKAGAAFDVQVTSLPLPGGSTTPVTFRISRAALERSVVRLIGSRDTSAFSSGLPGWDADFWVFEDSVEAARKSVQGGLESSLNTSCEVDRERMLALDEHAFDQDMSGGWRRLAQSPRCRAVAADLIRDYRAHNKKETPLLTWHEGQLRADMGDTAAAIALFERSYKPAAESSAWNKYVDATIAFLRGDRKAFDAAREALAALPRPAGFDLRDAGGKPVPWPVNLDVVDRLGRCFGMTYSEAYGNCPK